MILLLKTSISVLTHPREMLPQLAEKPSLLFALVMGSVWGIERNLHGLFKAAVPLSELEPLLNIFFANVVFGILFGVWIFWLASWVLSWTACRLGGVISSPVMRTILSWSVVPHIATLVYLIALFVVQGQYFLVQDRKGLLLSSPALVGPFLLVQFVCSIWSIVVSVKGMSELATLSILRSIGAYLLGGLILLVPVLGGTLTWASLGRLGGE